MGFESIKEAASHCMHPESNKRTMGECIQENSGILQT